MQLSGAAKGWRIASSTAPLELRIRNHERVGRHLPGIASRAVRDSRLAVHVAIVIRVALCARHCLVGSAVEHGRPHLASLYQRLAGRAVHYRRILPRLSRACIFQTASHDPEDARLT